MSKMPKAKLVKLQIDELAGVDVGAQDVQGTVILKRKDGLTPVQKDSWSTAYKDSLPDSSFLYIEGGGKKDGDGKTTPRSLRHFPVKDLNGKVDLEHARSAVQEAPKSSLPQDVIARVQRTAEKMVAKEHTKMQKNLVADLKKRGLLTALKKRGMLTTAVEGHTHLLDDGDGAASGCTDGATMGVGDPYGSGYGTGYHWHPWSRSTDGTIMIGEAAGHTHELLTPDELQQILDAADADVDEEDTALVKSRAGYSTPNAPVNHGGPTSTGAAQMDAKDTEIADLKKRSTMLTKMLAAVVAMPESHRQHCSMLGPEGAESFALKSPAEREVDVQKALENDPVEIEVDGIQYRKSAGPAMISMAKRQKEMQTELAKARELTETTRLEKRARETVGNLGGTLPLSTRLMKAIEREFTDAKEQEAVVGMLKFASKLGAESGLAKGVDPGENPGGGDFGGEGGDPLEQFNAEVKKFAEAKGIKDEGEALEKFLGTKEGRLAKRKYDDTRGYGGKK